MPTFEAKISTPLVSASWLRDSLGAPDLRIVDASWRLPGKGDARDDYRKRHIPGAVFFPLDEIADRTSPLPHMLPSASAFEEAVGALGISETDRVVIYDDAGLFSAPRVWWSFRLFGHDEVAVLDGGLPAWREAGGAVTAGAEKPAPATYRAGPPRAAVCDAAAVREALRREDALILDARPAGRFAGAEDEPRPGLRRGHMPGAASLPASSIVGSDGRLRPPAELAKRLAQAGVSGERAVITSCGSGVTAAILTLALEVLERKGHALYDGSWAEWGDEKNDADDFPVATGG